ncbi:tpiA [Acrasis kona]|uniref:TpiA n=1 Tax=Acrasis kona TaxID=1008807 RepID=A0AAW2ZA98_9EUKA
MKIVSITPREDWNKTRTRKDKQDEFVKKTLLKKRKTDEKRKRRKLSVPNEWHIIPKRPNVKEIRKNRAAIKKIIENSGVKPTVEEVTEIETFVKELLTSLSSIVQPGTVEDCKEKLSIAASWTKPPLRLTTNATKHFKKKVHSSFEL